MGAGEGPQQSALGDGVIAALTIFRSPAAVHIEMMGEGMERNVRWQEVEQRREGMGFKINTGRAGDPSFGVLDQAGTDRIEQAGIVSVVPDAPLGAIDGMTNFKEIGEGMGAIKSERHHLPPAFGFAERAAILDESQRDGMAAIVQVQGLIKRPVPGVGILMMIEAQEQRED